MKNDFQIGRQIDAGNAKQPSVGNSESQKLPERATSRYNKNTPLLTGISREVIVYDNSTYQKHNECENTSSPPL